jgi:translation initiation factor IF-2
VAHAQAAQVPIVVAVNKIDKPEANPDTVKNELAALGLQPEDWGGDTIFIPCSAITGEGVDSLLENVVLQAELLELTANPGIPAEGVVLEAYLDRGRGPVANILIRDGSLDAGDYVVAGGSWGRVRAMTDDRGNQLPTAGPATPVEVLGLAELPAAGDLFYEVTDQRKAQQVAGARKKPGTTSAAPTGGLRGLDQFQALMQTGDTQELRLVVKADVQGSVEALQGSLTDLATEKVKVNVIHTGVGGITENDVMLASASQAIVLGFNVRPQGKASSTAKKEGVEIRTYSVIYEAIDEVKAAMKGLLAPKIVQEDLGKAEVRQTFGIPKIGTIAGCMVLEGKISRGGKARLVRDGVVVWEGPMGSLRRFKEDIKEVQAGMECGIGLQGFNDVKEQDVIECYEEKQVEATLE